MLLKPQHVAICRGQFAEFFNCHDPVCIKMQKKKMYVNMFEHKHTNDTYRISDVDHLKTDLNGV